MEMTTRKKMKIISDILLSWALTEASKIKYGDRAIILSEPNSKNRIKLTR